MICVIIGSITKILFFIDHETKLRIASWSKFFSNYDKAKDALEKGLIDAVGIGRASLADPDYAKKLYDDTPERIRPCIGCNMGCFRRCCETGEPVSCAVNPQAARETVNGLKPANGKKKVVVVGGG